MILPAPVVWFTGLSGAGKTTLAQATAEALHTKGLRNFVLDGDRLRNGLCSDLGFSLAERSENIRRAAEVARLLAESGSIVLAAFISPLAADRALARSRVPRGHFIEVHCSASLQICEARDVKGLYRRARAGEIAEFTGISSPFEAPTSPELSVASGEDSIAHCVEAVLSVLLPRLAHQGRTHPQ